MLLLPALLLQATRWLDELELVIERKCGSNWFLSFLTCGQYVVADWFSPDPNREPVEHVGAVSGCD